ncbi:hypothetical protein ACCS96_46015, partial [Rhizobium ruizarguesonis]
MAGSDDEKVPKSAVLPGATMVHHGRRNQPSCEAYLRSFMANKQTSEGCLAIYRAHADSRVASLTKLSACRPPATRTRPKSASLITAIGLARRVLGPTETNCEDSTMPQLLTINVKNYES